MEIVRNHRGAFCCDGVGLGKTFIGLMLIERLVFFEKKNVVLIVPKSTRKDVWEKTLEKFLPDLQGAYINLQILNHTDFNRSGDFPSIINSITDRADAVIIDEAHNFRNKGSQGNDEKPRSRYWKLFDLIEKKECFFLTATPINNRLADFRNLVELFSRGEESYFAKRLGIQSLKGHFIKLEKQILELYDSQGTYLETNIEEAKEAEAM
jgi:superfamily II DNA or RNA helicase